MREIVEKALGCSSEVMRSVEPSRHKFSMLYCKVEQKSDYDVQLTTCFPCNEIKFFGHVPRVI